MISCTTMAATKASGPLDLHLHPRRLDHLPLRGRNRLPGLLFSLRSRTSGLAQVLRLDHQPLHELGREGEDLADPELAALQGAYLVVAVGVEERDLAGARSPDPAAATAVRQRPEVDLDRLLIAQAV